MTKRPQDKDEEPNDRAAERLKQFERAREIPEEEQEGMEEQDDPEELQDNGDSTEDDSEE